jgi:glycosyltransferase involved in cell wall biosynthesis
MDRPKVLIFIVAYNAAKTITSVLSRIPQDLGHADAEILLIDDASSDDTFERANAWVKDQDFPFPVTVLHNPVNQGYGGNQKIGYHYAIRQKFDFVALIHGDGQYAPEELPRLLTPLFEQQADAVFGSRMMTRLGALRGGMPLYKFVGNKILSFLQNGLMRSQLTEFHSGYRLYSVRALKQIPFEFNTNDFHFDTEIIVQLMLNRCRIHEMPIPTYYGDEICHVDGLRYAWNVLVTMLRAKIQGLGLIYDRRYDLQRHQTGQLGVARFEDKLSFESTHRAAVEFVVPGSTVADIGCASGYVSRALKAKGCRIIALDRHPLADDMAADLFLQVDLDAAAELPEAIKEADHVLLLDVIEHLLEPEFFAENLRRQMSAHPRSRLLISTGNIAFCVQRLALLCGQFNYGPRGILDLTHTRLFTFASLARLLTNAGFIIDRVWGVPAPFPLAFGGGRLARILLTVNRALIGMWRNFFSYQIMMECRPTPTLQHLLSAAMTTSAERMAASSRAAVG